MHDATGSALIARLDMPDNRMSKVDSIVDTQMAADHGEDPPTDASSDGTSVGPEVDDKPEQSRSKGIEPVVNPELQSSIEKTETPQPVTPETPQMQEISTFKAPKLPTDQEEVLESDKTQPSSAGDGAASPPVPNKLQNLPAGEVRPHRGRIVSLDRARVASGYNSPDTRSDDERQRRHVHHKSSQSKREAKSKYDDASSSDDDSSYFAAHQPSPKSGRSYSYSSASAGSAQAMAASFYQNSVSRGSDASLSFSDESDDDMHQGVGVHFSPMIPPKGSVADMHLYPQRITRMHSVSSLVSSASSEDGRASQPGVTRRRSSSSMSSHTTTGTSSDPSVRAELHDMAAAATETRPASHMIDASGRRSPIMGHAGPNYFFGSPSPGGLKQSPPPIMQGYAPPPGMPHPQPQPMSHDQMAAWMSAENAAGAQVFQGGQQPVGYGTMQMQSQGMPGVAPQYGGFRNISDNSSSLTLPFVYSEDDETEEGTSSLFRQMAGGLGTSFGGRGSSSGVPGKRNGTPGGNDLGKTNVQTPPESSAGFQTNSGSVGNKVASATGEAGEGGNDDTRVAQQKDFAVYWRRWLMLFYMSVLNLLSDWTCYSVAPIALLTETAFGNIDPEKLVVVFLGANAIATACEPIILARLGLRRTVLFGSLLLMIGSVIKSGGGVPPFLPSDLEMGHDELRLYLGFFVVGLSQPLYQCTPALLSASWFPEKERTMATGVALNSNQLGIGFAFIFGTLLVETAEDISGYFGLLSTLSTIVFLGTLVQFDDAPPTPPSSSARVIRGTFEVNLPSIDTIVQSVRGLGTNEPRPRGDVGIAAAPSPAIGHTASQNSGSDSSRQRRDARGRKSSRSSSGKKGGSTRRRTGSRSQTANTDSGLSAPSSARSGPTAEVVAEIAELKSEAEGFGADADAPFPVMPGRVGQADAAPHPGDGEGSPLYRDAVQEQDEHDLNQPPAMGETAMPPGPSGLSFPPGGPLPPGMVPPFGAFPHPHYQYPYWDPRVQQQMQHQQAYYQQQYYYHQQVPQPPQPYYYQMPYPHHPQGYDFDHAGLPIAGQLDEGVEPIVTITDHHLDIDIRDDQVIRSIRACLARPGFIHALVAFAVSGIVINTLSTFMDYLVRLNGAPKYYTGIVGGSFQGIIMISSLIIGGQTDKTRAYYSVAIGMLVLGAFGLAECGVSLDSDRGSDLRWTLLFVAALVGPLQPVSTELGVEVAYPLSENTVLVIQQLFSNLLSALFIPFFKALKDFGSSNIDDTDMVERPQYTFSFYLLIVLHTSATVFFATFNGKYLRYEHELQKKADEERQNVEYEGPAAFHPFYSDQHGNYSDQHGDYSAQQGEYDESYEGERQPLVSRQMM